MNFKNILRLLLVVFCLSSATTEVQAAKSTRFAVKLCSALYTTFWSWVTNTEDYKTPSAHAQRINSLLTHQAYLLDSSDYNANQSIFCKAIENLSTMGTWDCANFQIVGQALKDLNDHKWVDLNQRRNGGWTLLHTAVVDQQAWVVNALIAAGINIHATLDDGRTALDLAKTIATQAYEKCQNNEWGFCVETPNSLRATLVHKILNNALNPAPQQPR